MSKDLLYELIEALTILPGVGKKSAQRMALFLLDKNKMSCAFSKNIRRMLGNNSAMRSMQAINLRTYLPYLQ